MKKDLPRRKNIRLYGYDYSQNGAYFVTVCTKDRHELLGKIVGGGFHAAPTMMVSNIGQEVIDAISYANAKYKGVEISKYIIMPNHIHMIIMLTGGHGNPPLHTVVGQIKSYTTKKWNELCNTEMMEFWQRGYHDRIIRNEAEFQKIWQYIDTNPHKWEEDCYHP